MRSWTTSDWTPPTARARSCTLYTLEMHLHYLHEVKARRHAPRCSCASSALDRKRIHVGAGAHAARGSTSRLAATAEVMLLHVRQQRGKPRAPPFPPAVAAALAELKTRSAALPRRGSARLAPHGTARAARAA